MTIPRLPGPLDWLTSGAQAGFQAYDQSKAQQYEQAQTGARLILGLVQAGKLDPQVALQDPAFKQVMQAAKIPVPSAESIVPSVAAEEARQTTGYLRGLTPGSTEQRKMLKFPTLGEISEDDFKAALNEVRQQAAKDPATARIMAEVLPLGVAGNIESAQQAASAPKEYDFAAENFVAQASLEVQKGPSGRRDLKKLASRARELAQADPQYSGLVTSGQLSDEYFAKVAARIGRLDEDDLKDYARIAAQRVAVERETRLHYDNQRKAYDTMIQQLQNEIKMNALEIGDTAMLQLFRKKQAANPKYQPNEMEVAALRKIQAVEEASAQIDELSRERQDVVDRFIGTTNPINPQAQITPPQGQQPAQRRAGQAPTAATPQINPRIQAAVDLLRSGRGTKDQLMQSSAFTAEEKAAILRAAGKQ